MYKVIMFDLDNTIIDYDTCEIDSMKRAVSHHRVMETSGVEWDSFWEAFLVHNYSYWEQRFVKKLGYVDIIEHSLKATLGDLSEPSLIPDIARTYWELFCETCHLETGANDILRQASDGYRLGVISNGAGEAQHRRMQSGGIYHYFEGVVISDEVGYWKPDPAIFGVALDKLQAQRHEVLYVGDSLKDDYRGAMNAGIDFCYYNRKKQPLDEHIHPKFSIHHLSELGGIL